MITSKEVDVVRFTFDEDPETGGQCGPVLVSFRVRDEFYMPYEVEHGEELVGFSGCAGERDAIASALRLYPNAVVIDDDGEVHKQ